jgi:hypothetical protein
MPTKACRPKPRHSKQGRLQQFGDAGQYQREAAGRAIEVGSNFFLFFSSTDHSMAAHVHASISGTQPKSGTPQPNMDGKLTPTHKVGFWDYKACARHYGRSVSRLLVN